MVPIWSWIFWSPQLIQRLFCQGVENVNFEITLAVLFKISSIYPQSLIPAIIGELKKIF